MSAVRETTMLSEVTLVSQESTRLSVLETAASATSTAAIVLENRRSWSQATGDDASVAVSSGVPHADAFVLLKIRRKGRSGHDGSSDGSIPYRSRGLLLALWPLFLLLYQDRLLA